MAAVTRLHWTELPAAPGQDVDVYHDVHDGDYEHHDHDFFEIAVVLEGQGVHEVLHGRDALRPGDAFTIRPGSWHAFVECRSLLVASCCVRTQLLERELLWLAEEPELRFLLWPGAAAGDGIVHVRLQPPELVACDEALRRLATPPPEHPRPFLIAHLLLALRRLASALVPAQLEDARRLSAAPAAVFEALRLLEADMARDWKLSELAAQVALSPAYLSRRFHQAIGRPPMAHLAALRAEAAAVRLLRGDEPVAAVGAAVGWGDPNYFTRRFRAHFGVSPTAFRRRRWRRAANQSGS